MKVWIASFFVLFTLAELYQWAKHLTLPLPIYILGGAFLAIASNWERRSLWPVNNTPKTETPSEPPAVAPAQPSSISLPPTDASTASKSISFTINRSAANRE